jgi:hypothetical protein
MNFQTTNAQTQSADQQHDLLYHALDYAKRGWHVFPCQPSNKAPYTANGFKDATTDPETIKAWWARWPDAMIGVAMGSRSGVWALDPDAPKAEGDADGVLYWATLCAKHPKVFTHTHLTPGGGRHKLFKWNPDRPVGNREGFLKGKGINVRGEGGYIIAPPSARFDGKRYEIESPTDFWNFAEAPDWLHDLLDPPAAPPQPSISQRALAQVARPNGNGDHRKYAEAAPRSEAAAVASAPDGQMNNTLNNAALKLGQLVGAKLLTEQEVTQALYNAAEQSGHVHYKGARATYATINSGLQAGVKEPRQIPERGNGSTDEWLPPISPPQSPEPDEPLDFVEMSNWDAVPAPKREWAVENRVPLCQPTYFSVK